MLRWKLEPFNVLCNYAKKFVREKKNPLRLLCLFGSIDLELNDYARLFLCMVFQYYKPTHTHMHQSRTYDNNVWIRRKVDTGEQNKNSTRKRKVRFDDAIKRIYLSLFVNLKYKWTYSFPFVSDDAAKKKRKICQYTNCIDSHTSLWQQQIATTIEIAPKPVSKCEIKRLQQQK